MSRLFNSILRAFRVVPNMPPFDLAPIYDGDLRQNGDLACDGYGALWVRQAPNVPSGSGATRAFNYHTNELTTIAEVFSFESNGTITQFGGYNDSAIDYYVQLYNANYISPPLLDSYRLVMTFLVRSKESFVWTPSRNGYQFDPTTDGGMMWALSTTRYGLTPPAPDTEVYIYAEGYHGLAI